MCIHLHLVKIHHGAHLVPNTDRAGLQQNAGLAVTVALYLTAVLMPAEMEAIW